MKPSEEEEFKEKSNEEKMEKEMKNNDEENDWNDWIYQWFFGISLLNLLDFSNGKWNNKVLAKLGKKKVLYEN